VKLLLDTHVWLWSFLAPEKLSGTVADALEDSKNELWLSPISVWELILLTQKKRVTLNSPVEKWVQEAMATAPLREAPLNSQVILATMHIHLPHRDPADTLIVATARIFEMTLVTFDRRLRRLKEIRILRTA
jgi:PIN domain nuclease of toxin-antitoxin system